MEKIMLSIAMATYNGEKYLAEQLDSILSQTVQDFELIVCDDCSTDATVEILNRYAEKDSRIKVFVNDRNLGFKKNFEKAIRLCSGEYIALSDQDDVWLPEHLEKLLNLIGDADIACGNAELVNAEGYRIGQMLSENEHLFCLYEKDLLLYRIICLYDPFQGASMLIKSGFLKNTGVLPIPDGVLYHDAWFAACACVQSGINYIFEPITLYRQHGYNSSGVKKKWNPFAAILRSLGALLKLKKKYKTDRFAYITELKKRFSISKRQNQILDDCLLFLKLKKNMLKFKEKKHAIQFFWQNYQYIFTCNDNKYRLARTVKLFLEI